VLNAVFIVLIVASILTAIATGTMQQVTAASIESAKVAVTIALGLIGVMALWLGLMRVVRDAGGLAALSRALGPLLNRLFPDVPADHPAMGAMLLNISANMLGLGNAATPFGLKAMRELATLNDRPGVATNSMALFLAINTSGVAVLPLGVIALRAQMDAVNAAGIIMPSILATLCSTVVGVFVCKTLQSRAAFRADREVPDAPAESTAPLLDVSGLSQAEDVAEISTETSGPRRLALWAFVLAFPLGFALHASNSDATAFENLREFLNWWLIPFLIGTIVMYGFSRKVKVYESLIQGAKEGFQIAVMIIPFLVAILVAVGMFRASGALDFLIAALQPMTSAAGIPAESLPMALVRPLSGQGAFAVMSETLTTYGPDSFVGWVVSTINGSTETTFYVLAIYFGSIQIRATRHTILACLAADLTGFVAAVAWCRVFFTPV
jgi:spore maturation protein SpmA